ncbi:semaphorin-4A [Acanthopagrus latus]|uniref:semaphorin-4A n=1 Tax=Acanthopagrus latus TaxID=8177 RepID=UPI00187C9DED|nr:semaphorin-4A [Acanthopagrus latus]
MSPSVLLLVLLLGLRSSTGSLPPPRTSFLLNSAGRPLVHFRRPDLPYTTTLLLSDDGSTLYVGAQDALLSLDVSQSDDISLKKKVEWSPSAREIRECASKGKNQTVDCLNLVHVLQSLNSTHLYACGSFAFSPHDVYIDTESFSIVQDGSAKGRCPFSPFQRSSAITVDGELFTATTTDFKGVQPQISRHFSKHGRPDVSQDSSVTLKEPTFVSSSLDPADRKLYFFFSEVGKEFSFIDDLQIARVAQVCKDDVGGQRTLQKKWTSFAKAPLICQSPKQLPFNVLQDVFTLQPAEGSGATDTLFYGVFTSQWSTGPESAVCVFKLQDVRNVFTQSYRTFDMETHQWSPLVGKHSYLGKCGLSNASDSVLAEVKRSFLTSDSVKPDGGGPIVVSSGEQYIRVAAMVTEAADGKQYTVLFLLTESGFLHKVVLFDRGAQVIEEIQVFTQAQPIKSMLLSSTKGVLYIGTSEGVTAVPVADCSTYRTCRQCVLAGDPLCGWSRTGNVCTRLDGSDNNTAQDLGDDRVEDVCPGLPRDSKITEVGVRLNEVVALSCVKPSNLAALTWTSPRLKAQTKNLFIQSADGTLSFIATTDTIGSYRCEAEEGRYKEVVMNYSVQLVPSPRSMSPVTNVNNEPPPSSADESYEDIPTETAPTSTTPTSEHPEDDGRSDMGDKFTTNLKEETESNTEHSGSKNPLEDDLKTSKNNAQVMPGQPDDTQKTLKQKSYYSELVVVSLLLAACVCVLILAGLHMWNQRRAGLRQKPLVSPEASSKTDPSMESVPSLSSPEEPEELQVKVEE